MYSRTTLVAGALLAALGVLFGAFGAHWLESLVPTSRLDTWETAVRYQMIHGVGLLILGTYMRSEQGGGLNSVATLLTIGVALFSGSLYLLVLTDATWLGAVAPIGGIAMISGWGVAALVFLRSGKKK